MNKDLEVWVGIDASVKRDSTALVACAFDGDQQKVRIVWHRIFQPSPAEPLDFEESIERTLHELREQFRIREIRYDPYQMVSVAQRLSKVGFRIVEYPQTTPNLTASSTNLYELIKGRNLLTYDAADLRQAIGQAIAIETSRGWRIAKEKTSSRIDVVIALAMASLAAIEAQRDPEPLIVAPIGLWQPSPWDI